MESVKKKIVRTLAAITQTLPKTGDMFGDYQFQIVLTTAAGIIIGTVVEEKSEDIFGEVLFGVLDAITEKNEANTEGNDGFMLLSDVTIINGETRTKLNNLIVFYDQIIGATFETANVI